MDDLFEKTTELLKSLLSVKTGASKDLMVPAIKPPSLKAPSIKQPSTAKIPSGLPPPSKKDPAKVAEQLKNPNPEKVKIEVLKVEKNGQWSLDKGINPVRLAARKNTPRWDQPHDKREPNIFSSLPSSVPGKEVHNGTPRPGEEKNHGDAQNHDYEKE